MLLILHLKGEDNIINLNPVHLHLDVIYSSPRRETDSVCVID